MRPSSPPPADAAVRAAAILADDGTVADALLAAAAQAQRAAGRRVRGLLMTYPDTPAGCARSMVLVDLHSGRQYLVSQPMGSGSTACRADPQGFARASRVLRDALADAPDLVISNRFGSLEAEGAGFTDELLQLMAAGIPVLTAVNPRFEAAWSRFSGGAPTLPPQADAVSAWLARVLPPA